jgi:hypothetical protein
MRWYVGIVVYAYSTTGKTFKHAFLRSFMMSRWSHWHSATGSDRQQLTRGTLSGDNAAFAKGAEEQLEVGFLEKGFRWAFRIGASVRGEMGGKVRVGDDDIERVFVILEEFKAVSNVDLDSRMLEPHGHRGKVFLRDLDDGLGLDLVRRRMYLIDIT